MSGRLEFVLRIDSKGRILIPASIRRELGLRRVVRVRVEGGRLVIEPFRDSVEALVQTVIRGTTDVEGEIGRLRRRVKEGCFSRD